jgi:chromosome segregation ATPase
MLAVGVLLLLVGPVKASVKSVTVQSDAERNSMIAKVIEMLGEEKDKISATLAAEAKVMEEYFEWCDDEQSETGYAIKTGQSKIEDLSALIEDNTAQIHSLDEEIADLGSEIAARSDEIKETTANREKDKEEFKRAEAEQLAMVEELESLEVELKKQMASMTTPPPVPVEGEAPAEGEAVAEALLQRNAQHTHQHTYLAKGVNLATLQRAMAKMVDSVWVDPQSKRNLALLNKDGIFIQNGEEPEEAPATVEIGADQMGAMQSNNANNLAAFEGLKGKAEEALQRQRDEEATKEHNFQLNIQSLKQAVALAENKVDDCKKDHSRLSEEKAEAEGELAEVQESKAADEKTLESLKTECDTGAQNWATRQKEAKAEMAAIDKAKEILSERVKVFIQFHLGGKHPSDPAKDAATLATLAQTRAKLIPLFRDMGAKLHSVAMLNLVSVASTEPLAQVKNLLNELIAKLEKEAAEAANLHAFCQEEKEKTTEALEKKDMTIQKLNARTDKASTKKQDLEEKVAELSGEIAKNDEAVKTATGIRNEEHAIFLKTEADFSGAADAVDDAMDALKAYYEGASLVQVSGSQVSTSSKGKAPPSLGGAKTDSAGGIISILETMGEDFRKTVKEARSEEHEDQKEFDTMVQEMKVAKAAKESEIKASTSEIKSLTTALHGLGADTKMASKEEATIKEYVAKLKPQCGGRTTSYAERKAKMDAEIEGLKQALAILAADQGTISFIQRPQRLRKAQLHN